MRTQEVETFRQRVEELEKRTSAELPAEEKKELEELRTFRKIFDTENDPEFKKQFDERISSVDEDVFAILKNNGLPEETEKQMRDLGLGKVNSKFWEQQILPRLPFVDQERVRRRLAERADVDDQRVKEVEKFQSQREQTLREREERQLEQFRQEQQVVVQHVEEIRKGIPWANPLEIPSKATKEERARIEAHNKYVEELEFRFQDALYPATPAARAEIAAAAVASTHLASSVNDLGARLKTSNERVKQLEQELSKIKSAGRIPSGEPTARQPRADVPDNFKSDDEAIEAGLQAAESSL